MGNKPPRYRKLYEKISISGDTVYKLNALRDRLTAENPDKKHTSYNKAIEYLLENQRT